MIFLFTVIKFVRLEITDEKMITNVDMDFADNLASLSSENVNSTLKKLNQEVKQIIL